MNRLGIALLLVFVFFMSCKKDDENNNQNSTKPTSYTPLSIGNYWVYENHKIEPNGNDSLLPGLDSIIVVRDTFIHGNTFLIAEGISQPLNHWKIELIARDSNSYLVDPNGRILFNPTNFTDSFNHQFQLAGNDTLYEQFYQLEPIGAPQQLPGGVFDSVLNFKGTVIGYNQAPHIPNPRYVHNLYAPGVGRILSSYFYFSSNQVFEKRLLRYHIN
jgi:hypothetical protein